MAGFALLVDSHNPLNETRFNQFLKSTADFKSLELPEFRLEGFNCVAAKLNSSSSFHRGYSRDLITGSWLFAIGTVIDTSKTFSNGNLDTILRDYLQTGDEVFSRLDGQFAMVLYDAVAEVTRVVTDPFGMIPVYYGEKYGQTFVSTSGLAVAKELQSDLDQFGARAFIIYGSTFGATIWQDVHLISPASVLNLGSSDCHELKYWSIEIDQTLVRLSEKQSIDLMIESFTNSLKQILSTEGKIWVSLTGGLDSRTLAALADFCKIPFKTYCHGPFDSLDVQIAQLISQKKGWDYEYYKLPGDWGIQRVSWFDLVLGQIDGHLDIIKMSRTIREQTIKAHQFDVSLWGFGGELHRGIYWKHELNLSNEITNLNYDRLIDYRVIPTVSLILKDSIHWNKLMRQEIKSRLTEVGEQNPDWPITTKLDMIGTLLERHVCGTTIASVLGQQRVILPYNLKENLIKSFSINYRWKTHSRLFRSILKRISPDLADMDIADGGPATTMNLRNINRFLPYWINTGEKFLWRFGKKVLGKPLWQRRNIGPSGYAYPTEKWLQETIIELEKRALVKPNEMRSSELFDPSQFKKLVNNSQVGSQQRESLLGRILALEMAIRSQNSSSNSVEVEKQYGF